jgi:hypothetical protein
VEAAQQHLPQAVEALTEALQVQALQAVQEDQDLMFKVSHVRHSLAVSCL